MNLPHFSKAKQFSFTLPVLLLLVTLVAGSFLVHALERIAKEHVDEQGGNAMIAITRGIENELGSSHAVVKALAGSPWILPALVDPNPENLEHAYSVLSRYNKSLDFSVCYLLDAQGKAVASSNRDAPESFVGKNYVFRPYFQEAIVGKTSVYMAAGVTSLERGFYAAHPVHDDSGKVVGVAAIKKNVDSARDILVAYPTSFLINPDGIIFMAGSREMVFKSLWPVSPGRARELKDSKQFSKETFEPVFDRPVQQGDILLYRGEPYQCFRSPITTPGWSLVLLISTKEVYYFRLLGWGITASMALIIILLSLWAGGRLKAEEKLQESQERFRAAFESSGIGMALVRPDGQWLQANAALCRIVGYSEEELLRKTFQDITYPEDLDADLAQVRRLLAGEFPHYVMEKRYFHKDGHVVWVLLTVSLVRNAQGVPLYFVSQIEDISVRKTMDLKLQQKIEELERFNRIAVGRELKMIELKEKIKALEKGQV